MRKSAKSSSAGPKKNLLVASKNASLRSRNVVDPLRPILDQVPPKVIDKIQDAQVQETASRAVALVRGVSDANTSDDPVAVANKARLDEVGLTPAKVAAIGQRVVELIADTTDRDEKEDAYHESVAKVTADRTQLDVKLAEFASRLRGSFGNTNAALQSFGVAPLGGGHNGGRKPAGDSNSERSPADSKKQQAASRDPASGAAEPRSTT